MDKQERILQLQLILLTADALYQLMLETADVLLHQLMLETAVLRCAVCTVSNPITTTCFVFH